MDNTNLNHNDYLPCKYYMGSTPRQDGIYKFTEEGKFYFSFLENGIVILRSEGYTSEGGRENGIVSILKNMENENQYKVLKTSDSTWAISLEALNRQEIARSCDFTTEAEAKALLPGARAIAREALLLMASSPKMEAPVKAAALLSGVIHQQADKEDDYLLCKEYQGHLVTNKEHNIALFRHQNGQYYFAFYHNDDSVKLRSEGFSSTSQRDIELATVIKYINSPSQYSTIQKAGYEIRILKDHTGREIGRSCPKKIVIAAPSAATTVVDSAKGGFQWWWLLALLLLLALFFWWRSCNQPVAEVTPVVEAPVVEEVVKDTDGDGIKDDTDKCPNLPGIADNLGCPEMILYYTRDEDALTADDKINLDKVVTFLNNNPNVHLILEGHTSTLGEADYNLKLSERRVNNSVAYLVGKGIDAGRLKAVGFGEQFPVGDNSTEEGRVKSRRTVIRVDH